MNSNLIDNYVSEIGRRLPRQTRNDIEAEIRSTLQDMLDERSQKAGKPVDEEMTLEVLKAYGAPEKVAASYAEAWALAADESSARAVKILRGMPSSGTWAGPRALLLARLDIDSGAKDEAKAVLDAAAAAKLFVGDDVTLAASLLAEATAK